MTDAYRHGPLSSDRRAFSRQRYRCAITLMTPVPHCLGIGPTHAQAIRTEHSAVSLSLRDWRKFFYMVHGPSMALIRRIDLDLVTNLESVL